MNTHVFGYARVSAQDQNLNRQLDAFARFGIDPKLIYADKASGKDFKRPQYLKLKRRLREGDVMVIMSIDRLGRNYNEIIEEWRAITKVKHADIVVLDMPLLDTRSNEGGLTHAFISDIVLQLLSYVAQIERENIKRRQAEGIAAARARGVKLGRPRLERTEQYRQARDAYLQKECCLREAAKRAGISASTFSRWIKEDAEELENVK